MNMKKRIAAVISMAALACTLVIPASASGERPYYRYDGQTSGGSQSIGTRCEVGAISPTAVFAFTMADQPGTITTEVRLGGFSKRETGYQTTTVRAHLGVQFDVRPGEFILGFHTYASPNYGSFSYQSGVSAGYYFS